MPEWIRMFFGMLVLFNNVYLTIHIVLPANAHIRIKSILNEIGPLTKVNISQKRANHEIRPFVVVLRHLLLVHIFSFALALN